MLWMMVPGTIGLAATQVNILVNTILATSQGRGAVSWLNYAFRLMQFPIGLFGVSLASATLPVVSALWVRKDVEGVERTLTQSLKQVFAINLPASAGLAFLGVPILELIFQYGRFQASDTRATALALAMYAVGLTAYSAVKVLVPACYALGNTRVPVLSSFLAVAVTIVLNLIMVRPFGYWGLALGTSVAALVNSAFLLIAVRKLIEAGGGRFPYRPLITSFLKHLTIALVMGVVCWASARGLASLLPEQILGADLGKLGLVFGRLFRTGLLVAEGIGIVLLLSRLLGVTETTDALQLFIGKLKKKLSRPQS
jgi:putative peptidoglycan lipid II flippase